MARTVEDAIANGGREGSLAAQAYERLKRLIISCELAPGSFLTEAGVVEMLGIGKTPVREALGRLGHDGLVRSMPRHGYEVTPITLGNVQELYDFRMIIEPAAAELAAGHVDAKLLRKLDALCRAGYVPGDLRRTAEFLRANHEFHASIARCSGNRRLADAVVRVLEESERLFYLGLTLRDRTKEMAHEHRELVEALVAGDVSRARAITAEQIEVSRRMVLDAVLSSRSLRSARLLVHG